MRTSRLASIGILGLLPLMLLAGCSATEREAAEASPATDAGADGASASSDEWNNPVGSLWWTKDVHACVFNHTSSPLPITWYKRTGGDTSATITTEGSSCASDGHGAFTTEHSEAQAQISVGGSTYWLFFENPPVGRPDLGVWRSYQSNIIDSASLDENGSATFNIDGRTMTAKRLTDSSDAKELQLHINP